MSATAFLGEERNFFDWHFPPGKPEDLLGCEILTRALAPENPDIPAGGLPQTNANLAYLYRRASDRFLKDQDMVEVFMRLRAHLEGSTETYYWTPRHEDLERCWHGFCNWHDTILTPALWETGGPDRIRQVRAALRFN